MPTYPYPLTLVNPGAEFGNGSGWTRLGASDSDLGVINNPGNFSPYSGSYCFVASTGTGTNNTGDHPTWGQTVDIPSDAWADIDGGLYWANATCQIATYDGDVDYGRINVDCLDANGSVLATGNGQYYGTITAWKLAGAAVKAPKGTRKLRVWTNSQRTAGAECSVYFDDFALQLIAPPDMSASTPHRFWQMICDQTWGDATYCTLDRLLWYDTSNNPITTGTFTVNEFLGGYPISGLLTKNDNSYCAMVNRGGQQWACYDLGAGNAIAMGSAQLSARPDGYTTQSPQYFRLQWSDDGGTFFDCGKWQRQQQWQNGEDRRFYTTGQRYRIVYYSNNTYAYFKNLELRGVVGGPDLTFPCDPSTGLGGLASGDSGNYGPWIAFDDQANDNYIGNGSNDHWIEWTFPTPVEVAEVLIGARNNYGQQMPTEVYVKRSDDNGLSYYTFAYTVLGTSSNGQNRTFTIADNNKNIFGGKVAEYVVEGPPPGAIMSAKMAEYVVEGLPDRTLKAGKIAEYVVEGPSGIYAPKVAEYVVEGPPAPGTFGPFVDAGGHRYWRLYNRRTHSNDQYPVGITYLQMRRANGQNIIGFGGTASASKTSNGGGDLGFDGRLDTMWQPDRNQTPEDYYGHGEWLAYDFGDGWTPRIDSITIYPDKDSMARTPFFFEIQYSDDGTNWATDWMVLNNVDYQYGVGKTFNRPVFVDERKGRFWALHFLSNSPGGTNFGGAEWGLMNEEDGTSIVQGKTSGAFTSSSSGGEDPIRLFDGNVGTIWSTISPAANGGEYVAIDLGSNVNVEIRQITWTSRTDGNLWIQAPVSGQMLRSMDGVTFEPLWQFTGVPWSSPGGVTNTIKTPLPIYGAHVGRRRNGVTVVF